MKRRLFALSAVLALVLGLVTGPASSAKPADLPAQNDIQCSECGEKTPHGSIRIGLDIFTGRITVKVEVADDKIEPAPAIDAFCPALAPAYFEQLLKFIGESLTNGQRPEADGARAQKARALLEMRLFEPVNLTFKDVPFQQAIKDLAHASGVRIVPDYRALKDAKIDLDHPVSLAVKSTAAHAALAQLLSLLRLTYVIENDMVKITPMGAQVNPNNAAARAARARDEQAQRIFEIAERHRRASEFDLARKLYQQVHLLTPTTLHGRMAIVRLIEIEERMRESSEEQGGPGREDDPEQVYRDMRDRSVPLGLVQISYYFADIPKLVRGE